MTNQLLLSHFSRKPIGEIVSVAQGWKDDYRSCYGKPKGLWVSVDGEDDWHSWCTGSMPEWLEGVTRYRVHIAEQARVLHITDISGMYRFQHEFARETEDKWHEKYIDWPAVAEKYQGIIIAPYQWPCRMDMDWYYCWDCASGCIWDSSAIARIEEIREAA